VYRFFVKRQHGEISPWCRDRSFGRSVKRSAADTEGTSFTHAASLFGKERVRDGKLYGHRLGKSVEPLWVVVFHESQFHRNSFVHGDSFIKKWIVGWRWVDRLIHEDCVMNDETFTLLNGHIASSTCDGLPLTCIGGILIRN